MRLVISINDRYLLLILLFVVTASGMGLALAYNTNNPAVMGHSWGEMVCDNNLCLSGGKVGIGTGSPSAKLDLAGGRPIQLDSSEGNIIINGDSGGWAMGTYFKGSGGTNRGGFGVLGGGDALTYYYIGPSFGSPYMVLNNVGSVGIGTTNPIRTLQVNGELSITRNDRVAFIDVSDPAGNGGGTIWLRGLTNGGTAQTDATVLITGILGIGTATPRNDLGWPGALDVQGQIRGAKYYDDDIGYYADLNSGANLGGNWIFNGNVGIGTAGPAYPLDVSGNARVGAGGAGYLYLGNRGYYIGDDGGGTDIQTNAPNIYVNESNVWKRLLREGDMLGLGSAVPANTKCGSPEVTLTPQNLEIKDNRIAIRYYSTDPCPCSTSVTKYTRYFYGPTASDFSSCVGLPYYCGTCDYPIGGG
jgi:hypothetical protein